MTQSKELLKNVGNTFNCNFYLILVGLNFSISYQANDKKANTNHKRQIPHLCARGTADRLSQRPGTQI